MWLLLTCWLNHSPQSPDISPNPTFKTMLCLETVLSPYQRRNHFSRFVFGNLQREALEEEKKPSFPTPGLAEEKASKLYLAMLKSRNMMVKLLFLQHASFPLHRASFGHANYILPQLLSFTPAVFESSWRVPNRLS